MAGANVAAVVEGQHAKPLKIIERPIATPGPGEIVVRNHEIAASPIDWKIQEYDFFINQYPNVLGSDSCGVVTAVGSGVTLFKVGDRVTGFAGSIINNLPDHGTWQTFSVLQEIGTTKIPDSMSFGEGAVFPMAIATATVTIGKCLGGPRLDHKNPHGLLIWEASSSVGSIWVQLAKTLGFTVFSTSSAAHHQYIKSLGAFEVFDYHDPSVVSKIVNSAKAAGTALKL